MNELTTLVRRSVCVAVLLTAAGLQGCGSTDGGQEDPAPDVGQNAPAADDYRHAHVLADGYELSEDVMTSASADTQQTHSGKKLAGYGTSTTNTTDGVTPGLDLSRGWTPQQLLAAYNVPITGANNKPAGYGIKVAIITVYHYSKLQTDLNKWAQQFGVKPINLNIINQAGGVTNSEMALNTNTAVQMVNTVSPGATVYVIEAKSEGYDDIYRAIQTVVNLGVNVVLLPFGADELSTQDSKTHLFLNTNIVWIAPSGSDMRPSFPATYAGVIAVGGTTLSSVAPFVETAWAESGAGMSGRERMPAFQAIPSVRAANTTMYRSVPDVAFNADPKYGAHIYISIHGGWVVVGGNTVSSAFFAGVVAIANQTRKAQNKPMLSSSTSAVDPLQSRLYGLMSTNGGPTNSTILNDVVRGYAGAGAYPTGPGYDIATGLGSLNVQKFIDYIATQR